jgi:LEA14-like dessication related protein
MLRRVVAILACAVILGGCSPYRAPALSVRKAAITNVTEEGVVIRFTLDAENSNGVELPLKKISYRLYLDGREVFRGIRSPEATLRRLGSQSITLPAVVTVDEQISKLQGPVRYRIEGTLSYITPGSVAQILFDPRERYSEGCLHLRSPEGTVEPADGGCQAGRGTRQEHSR